MIIGFTGTRQGMTQAQHQIFCELLVKHDPAIFIHGDCIGADAEAHESAKRLGIEIYIRPCDFPNMRAHCEGAYHTYPITKALKRNREIVEGCDLLIATPPTAEEQPRGGTWFTIRYARKITRRVIVIAPDGTVQ